MTMGLSIAGEHHALFLIKEQQIMAIHGYANQHAQRLSFGIMISIVLQIVFSLLLPRLTRIISKSAQIPAIMMTLQRHLLTNTCIQIKVALQHVLHLWFHLPQGFV